ncbi:MAG: extracellular solute-binding protein [Alphaproteobacteria bacterium]|nr:extracellular solute-binding protein [Alphaproteobacteria bacterium]
MSRLFTAFLFSALLCLPSIAQAETATPLHGIAMHGAPKYAADFKNLEYVNASAPKGGALHLAVAGTFDSLNPYVIKGVAAPGVTGMVYQTLMANTEDEAFSEYGLLAETIETPQDRSWVVFNLRPQARWNDGKPVTAEDVVWSFNTLMTEGHPFYRAYYANVKSAVAETPTRVKFTFSMAGNRELPLIMGQMPVLPKHYWAGKNFAKSTLEMPLGSGPYKVQSIDAGRRITYERVADWWAKDLPIVKGQYNFDTIVYDVYRDETVLLQAFFSGNYDFRQENVAKSWYAEYDQPPVRAGTIRKEEIHHSLPAGMQSFAFNIRRQMFQDAKVRQALGYAFDFEWSNKQFAYGSYKRTQSYFANSELASSGLPEGHELEILQKFKGQVPEEVFTREFSPPKTSGNGQDMRQNLTAAKKLLTEAGWQMGKDGLLEKDGQPFKFEILIESEMFERWISPMISNLKKLGIEAKLRIVDTSQYQQRMDNFDFDMTVATFGQSLSPGNEQRDFWSSATADVTGSHNRIGITNPVVDQLVDMIISSPDRAELVARTRALDRVLLWNYYVIPQWHLDYFRVAYWDKFGKPAISPKYGLGVVDTWWYDAEKAAKIASKVKPEAK